jgi:LysR family transcriptional regulator, regulator of the ytmI operon
VSERVASGALDAGICSPPESRLGLRFEPLYVEPMALLLPADHPLAAEERVDVARLGDERLLLTESGCAYHDLVVRALGERGAAPRTGIEITSMAALTHAVAAGLGPAIVPRALADPPHAGAVLRDVDGADLGLTVGLVQRPDGPAPGRVLDAFLQELRGALLRRG